MKKLITLLFFFASTIIYSQEYVITFNDLNMRPKKNTTDVFEDNGTKKNKKTLTGVSTYLGILKYYEKNGYTITKEIVMPLSIQNTAMYSYMLYIKKEE